MKKSLLILALLAGNAPPRPSPGAGEAPRAARAVTVIRAGRAYTVSSRLERSVVGPCLIVIENGRIADVSATAELPEGATVVDALNQVVIPGLVDAHTTLADAGRDADETIAPDVRAIDGYDFYQSNWRQLSGGVTTVYVAPGSQRLLSGLGAVVKTAGRDPRARTLVEAFGLRVTLGEQPKNPPPLYKPPVPASADHPILPAKRQYPASRMGEFAALREAAERPGPLRDRRQPLVVAAHGADDLIKAVLLAEELRLKIILVDAEDAPRVADFLAARKIPVIFNPSYAPGRRDMGDDARPSLDPSGSLEGAAELARAGIPFALRAPTDGDLKDLLFIAAAAVRSGVSEHAALASVTLLPAEILGVADRVGSIERGKDADLVFLSGEPLSPSSVVQRVMVNGEFVFQRKESDVQTYRAIRDASGKGKELLAVKGGRVLTVTQGVLPEGLVLAENGKIAYVGRGRPIPNGAKVIDAAGLTIVPGFIDFDSRLGFHLDRTEQALRRPRAGTGSPSSLVTPPSTLVRPDDAAYRAVASSGVTAILLSPESSGVCSVLKLSGDRSAVVKEVAALKLAAQGGTPGYQALKDALQRGKRYHEEWEAYEKAKKEPPKPAPAETPKAPDPISGTWKGTLEAPDQGIKADFTAELKLEGTRVTGSFQSSMIGNQSETVEGTFEHGELRIERAQEGMKVELSMKLVAPDHLKGNWKVTAQGLELKGPIECRRTAAAAETPGVAAKTEAKEPRKDEALEPYRKLFTREIPALVEARDLPAIESAAKAFRGDHSLDYILVGAEDAALAGDLVFEKGAGVALGPDFLLERRGAVINSAEALAAQGVPIAFCSSALSGTRHLPLTAAYAVRYGLDPFDALKAVTVGPARMLKLDGRLGSIERGRDADLVLFTGDPFAMSSRVKYVVIDGKIVYEAK